MSENSPWHFVRSEEMRDTIFGAGALWARDNTRRLICVIDHLSFVRLVRLFCLPERSSQAPLVRSQQARKSAIRRRIRRPPRRPLRLPHRLQARAVVTPPRAPATRIPMTRAPRAAIARCPMALTIQTGALAAVRVRRVIPTRAAPRMAHRAAPLRARPQAALR